MLDLIVDDVRRGLDAIRAKTPEHRSMAADLPPARDLAAHLTRPGLSVIAEIKRASPSRGLLNADLVPADQAAAYARGGASAISVLTEPDHFLGSPADLVAVRQTVEVPVLRKDFTLDPAHIWEARAMGADAVLLIVAVLGEALLTPLLEVAAEAGVSALVEVHDLAEAEIAVASGADIIGVNNRDLTTFTVDLATAETVAPLLADVAVTVGESGIHTAEDAARMVAAGYDAVLVGESLVTSGDPAASIQELRTAADRFTR